MARRSADEPLGPLRSADLATHRVVDRRSVERVERQRGHHHRCPGRHGVGEAAQNPSQSQNSCASRQQKLSVTVTTTGNASQCALPACLLCTADVAVLPASPPTCAFGRFSSGIWNMHRVQDHSHHIAEHLILCACVRVRVRVSHHGIAELYESLREGLNDGLVKTWHELG